MESPPQASRFREFGNAFFFWWMAIRDALRTWGQRIRDSWRRAGRCCLARVGHHNVDHLQAVVSTWNNQAYLEDLDDPEESGSPFPSETSAPQQLDISANPDPEAEESAPQQLDISANPDPEAEEGDGAMEQEAEVLEAAEETVESNPESSGYTCTLV